MAILNPIDVDHRKDKKDEIFLDLIELSVGHKIINDSLKDEWTLSLARMLTGHQNDAFELISLLCYVLKAEFVSKDFGKVETFGVL